MLHLPLWQTPFISSQFLRTGIFHFETSSWGCGCRRALYCDGDVASLSNGLGTYKRAQRGPLSRMQGAKQAREHLWQWQGNMEGLKVTWYKVKAHLSDAAVQHDSYMQWCRSGNEHADKWAKVGAAWHLEGTEHRRRQVQIVSQGMQELAEWSGFQAQVMADTGVRDERFIMDHGIG
eukprot:3915099-Amphidinium_carterae.1